ncbi:MAG: alanyl-tRNA editing protein [Candidatus Eisenbacteria bacterium]
MTSERLYYDDSYTVRFAARVEAVGERQGRPAVELERTYFYPESGGQEADRGMLGDARVVDVQADEGERVWHVLNAAGAQVTSGAELTGEVDWPRRFDHMQQHTGQHVLSAALERVLSAPTISSHLGEERSTLDVALADADWRAVERVEEAANRVVWEDRPVERHWTSEAGVHRFALRKPPQVTGRIRIVEIPDWDVSACGGTHTRRTGEVGMIKIVRWEKLRGNLRLEFLCGGRALRDHAWRTEALTEGARRWTLKDRDLIAHLERAAAERDELRKRLDEMVERMLAADARERVGQPPRGVAEFVASRPRDEVRRFALKCLEAGAPWVVAGAAAPDPVVIAGRAKALTGDLKALLPLLLERARGKGGGSPDLVQVAAADAAAAEEAWRWAKDEVAARFGG